MELKIEYLPVGSLKPYDRNARKHTAKDLETIVESIKEFGFSDPIGVWGENNLIVEGHGRLMAAKKLGMDNVPVVHLDHLTDEQRRAYALAHNKTAEMSDWIDDLLGSELDDLALDFDMSLFGFETEEKDEVIEDEYEPEIPDEAQAKVGNIYKLGRHRLMCGDSTNPDDVEKLVGDLMVDMLLTDPPYNVDYTSKEKTLLNWRVNARAEDGNIGITNDAMDDEEFRVFLTEAFFNAAQKLKPGGAFHIWHSEWKTVQFREALQDTKLKARQTLVWVKNNISIGKQDFQRQYEVVLTGDNLFDEEMEENGYEPCLYGWKDGAGHVWRKKRKEKDVLFFDKPSASKDHPTMKPILLFDYEMKCNTKKGDRVLDLFAGSGTTLMAAEQNGREALCMEYDPRYVDVIIDRWESFTGEKAELLVEGEGD